MSARIKVIDLERRDFSLRLQRAWYKVPLRFLPLGQQVGCKTVRPNYLKVIYTGTTL